MSRLLSVAHTIEQVENRTKTVTRRKTLHTYLEPGDIVTLVDRSPRTKQDWKRLVDVEIVSKRRERLDAITDDDVAREGFAPMTAAQFVAWYCQAFKCEPDTMVTRIEWRYP
ncbi:MAG: hypothetical protein MUF33_02085 [Candidatus Nanopelagicales bacterium]|jgi:hypothetical protein|nr:hypothetical protein [Candidatus Nanopelagicales bacterium]